MWSSALWRTMPWALEFLGAPLPTPSWVSADISWTSPTMTPQTRASCSAASFFSSAPCLLRMFFSQSCIGDSPCLIPPLPTKLPPEAPTPELLLDWSLPSPGFAATSTTIVSGCVAMRCRFEVYCCYSFFAVLVYAFVAHWVWAGNGWLAVLGALVCRKIPNCESSMGRS